MRLYKSICTHVEGSSEAKRMRERYLEDYAVGQSFDSGRLRIDKERITSHSIRPAGSGYTTLETKVHYLQAGDTAEIITEGRVVHSGRQIAMAEGRIVGGGGKLYAGGVETCRVVDRSAERRWCS